MTKSGKIMKKTHLKILFISLAILLCTPVLVFSAQAPGTSIVNPPVNHTARTGDISSDVKDTVELSATVVKVVGSVTVRNRGAIFWHDAKGGEPIKAGDEILTKHNGKIEIMLNNGNVIKLKPNSHLIVKKITRNNLTGDYENFFEVTKGKVWAKIEKLEGKSSFKIKTPTAIAGARGTIIYLVVFPDMTMILFEEGQGFYESTILDETFTVEPGSIYKLDDSGTVVEKLDSQSDEYQDITSGWDLDFGTGEGYSPPADDDTGGGADDDVDDDVDDTTEDQDKSSDEADKDKTNTQSSSSSQFEDIDGDGVPNTEDAFPDDPNEWDDTDGDGIGDNADTDDDNDRYLDTDEADNGTNPLSAASMPSDNDSDFISDLNDPDDDNDGYPDTEDAYPLDPTRWEEPLPIYDNDGDGIPDEEDPDDDNDGYLDEDETDNGTDPFSEESTPPDNDSDFISDLNDPDDDNDEALDTKEEARWWVTSNPLVSDTDLDGVDDYDDAFPNLGTRKETREAMRAKTLALLEENELRQEISDMLQDVQARYIDSVMEKISDAQTGKVLTDKEGYRVRTEQYVLRPNSETVEMLSITLRGGTNALSGLHTLGWSTTFDQSIDGLTGAQLRDLPWGKYLEGAIGNDNRVTGGPNYGTTVPNYYPTEMSVKMDNPGGDIFHERRQFSEIQFADEIIWQQAITSDQLFLDGAWRDFTVTTNLSSGNGNPKGFEYDPDGLNYKWDIRGRFYVIGDGDTGRITGDMSHVRFDTIWDALAVNMNGHQQIGENNIEIHLQSRFGGRANSNIDLIYIPWHRQHWIEDSGPAVEVID